MTEEGAGAPGERLPRAARLRAGSEIRAALRRGRRRRAGPLEIACAPSSARRPRFAVVVPRHGHTLAARNRLKRRLREIVRRRWLPEAHRSGRAADVVIRARPDAYRASFGQLESTLMSLLERVWPDPPDSGPTGSG